jgi:hypothetical protein
MATLILLTPHPGCLDYALEQLFVKKKDKMTTADIAILFEKIWTAQNQGLPTVNILH